MPSTDGERFTDAIVKIDAANRDDPNREIVDGVAHAKEVLYSRRMSRWLQHLEPHASEALQLAAHAQHIRRWTIPRSGYPMDRTGYHRWRLALAKFHAETTAEILRRVGYDSAMIERVQALIRKEKLKSDPEVQILEDVICLVFLESYFAEFSTKHDAGKVIDILKKTWRKMSPRAHRVALTLDLSPAARTLVERALAS
jgi:hypothetical protein